MVHRKRYVKMVAMRKLVVDAIDHTINNKTTRCIMFSLYTKWLLLYIQELKKRVEPHFCKKQFCLCKYKNKKNKNTHTQ